MSTCVHMYIKREKVIPFPSNLDMLCVHICDIYSLAVIVI